MIKKGQVLKSKKGGVDIEILYVLDSISFYEAKSGDYPHVGFNKLTYFEENYIIPVEESELNAEKFKEIFKK